MTSRKELIEVLHEVITPLREDIAQLDKKLDLHIQKTEFGFAQVARQDEEQNAILKEHHDRSLQLKRDNDLKEAQLRQDMAKADKDLADRVGDLEGPRKWLKTSWKILLFVGALMAIALTIMEVVGVRGGH